VNKAAFFGQAVLRSYAQVMFSDNLWFGSILLGITFIDWYVGLAGLVSVLVALFSCYLLGLHDAKIQEGHYGFNALLVGIGLGIYFEPGLLLLMIIVVSGVLTAFVSVSFEGILGKYGLPYLSLPFIITFWMLMLASRGFVAIGLNPRGIYVLNELYVLGGHTLVKWYQAWNELPLLSSVRTYFLSLSAIFFQHHMLAGMLVSIGLLIFSRIAFVLSWLGFYVAYGFYLLLGIPFTETTFSYIGFNYILTAVALGGFLIIPNRQSFLAVMMMVPIVVILTVALQEIMAYLQLPVHAFPFNVATLTFLYVLKFRVDNRAKLFTWFWQQNAPEKNLYNFLSYSERFGNESPVPIRLPFFGEWTVTQGHNGAYTHKDEWRHAWDFEITDEQGKTFAREGDVHEDYYCFGKSIVAPADGVVEEVVDDVDDNLIGERNLEQNWGNTIIIKHADYLYSKLSHLKKGAVKVKAGDRVKTGDVLAQCGNSGNSPYPHLHFQLQSTPHIGSRTIHYNLAHVLVRTENEMHLMASANPPEGAHVSLLPVQPELKEAFGFTVGRLLEWNMNDATETVQWEVKRDHLLNRYIECLHTGARAYFRADDAMLHFLHFTGDRKTLLYKFFLAAYQVSYGFSNNLVLKDQFPLNMAFHPGTLVWQDFLAPFVRFMRADYALHYPAQSRKLMDHEFSLHGTVTRWVFNRQQRACTFRFTVDGGGFVSFRFESGNAITEALCKRN
jgi:urea transporter/murein DD-endopeptidase MepM/ murein hydrolase activator NlpD